MHNKKIRLLLLVLLVSLLVSTVAYAYVGPELGSRILSYGKVGGDVQDLQNFLNTNGLQIGYADGIFGSKTKNGVISFQRAQGLTADGVVGQQTYTVINKAKKSETVKYTVKPGDSLYSIAVKNGVTVDQLSQANGLKSDLLHPGQFLKILKGTGPSNPPTPPVSDKPLDAILSEKGIPKPIPNFKIVVDKSDHLLTLYSGATPLKSYSVALSEEGLGDKVKAGDHLTPEGSFRVVEKYAIAPADQYLGTRWMRLGYPNNQDAQRGLNSGLIDQTTYNAIVSANNNGQKPPQNTALGGGIGIHGGRDTNDLAKDWTWGCTGLYNKDVEELFKYVTVGTPVTIQD